MYQGFKGVLAEENIFQPREGNKHYAILNISFLTANVLCTESLECPHDNRHFLSSRRSLFKGLRTDATEMAVPPSPVVEDFNVIEGIAPDQLPGFVYYLPDVFFF
jgi:hypothetical protein